MHMYRKAKSMHTSRDQTQAQVPRHIVLKVVQVDFEETFGISTICRHLLPHEVFDYCPEMSML